MDTNLTYEKVLELIREQSITFNQNLENSRVEFEKDLKKSRKEFEKKLELEQIARNKSRKEFEKKLELEQIARNKSRKEFEKKLELEQIARNKSREEFDTKLGELSGTWGKFVAEMVKPKIIELFKEKGIQIRTSLQNVEGYIGDERHYQIDLLLINSEIAVAVEIKSSLSVEDVKKHLERLEKIQKVQPERVNLSGVTIFGAVAGIIVENDADRFAYKKGLFVLRQKGNIVEIVNDEKFKPKEWKVDY